MDGIGRRGFAALGLGLVAALCAAAPALATDGKVAGTKWHDVNANGVRDTGEPVLRDWWIYLDTNRDGDRDAGEPATRTDASGNYSIGGIKWWSVDNHKPQTYDVREKPAGSQPLPLDGCSFPAGCKHTLTFSSGSHIYGGKDFGNYKRATIIVKKVNVGGAQTDSFDFASDALGSFSLAAADANGKTFSSLEPGTYGIAEQAHAGYSLTSATCDDGSAPAAIDLASGETVTCTFTNTRKASVDPEPEPGDPVTVAVDTVRPAAPPASQPNEVQEILPVKIVSGSARLRGPSGCTRSPFRARVSGRQIRRVTFWLDGRQVGRIVAEPGQTAFVLRVDPRKVAEGVHRVRARVVFAAASRTAPRTLRLSFQRCARQVVTPQFTG
jgi:Prealbumin-like fold domain